MKSVQNITYMIIFDCWDRKNFLIKKTFAKAKGSLSRKICNYKNNPLYVIQNKSYVDRYTNNSIERLYHSTLHTSVMPAVLKLFIIIVGSL